MINIYREFIQLGLSSKMIMQVHDELVFNVDLSERDRVKKIVVLGMQSAANLSVPLIVDVGEGTSWLDAH